MLFHRAPVLPVLYTLSVDRRTGDDRAVEISSIFLRMRLVNAPPYGIFSRGQYLGLQRLILRSTKPADAML